MSSGIPHLGTGKKRARESEGLSCSPLDNQANAQAKRQEQDSRIAGISANHLKPPLVQGTLTVHGAVTGSGNRSPVEEFDVCDLTQEWRGEASKIIYTVLSRAGLSDEKKIEVMSDPSLLDTISEIIGTAAKSTTNASGTINNLAELEQISNQGPKGAANSASELCRKNLKNPEWGMEAGQIFEFGRTSDQMAPSNSSKQAAPLSQEQLTSKTQEYLPSKIVLMSSLAANQISQSVQQPELLDNSLIPHSLIGLENGSPHGKTNCWLISILQFFAVDQQFQKRLEILKNRNYWLPGQFFELYSSYRKYSSTNSKVKFPESCANTLRELLQLKREHEIEAKTPTRSYADIREYGIAFDYSQEDAAVGARAILDCINEALEKEENPYQLVTTRTIENHPNEPSITRESFPGFYQVGLGNTHSSLESVSLIECVRKCFTRNGEKDEMVRRGDAKYNILTVSERFNILPPSITFCLSRYDYVQGRSVKNSVSVDIPDAMVLPDHPNGEYILDAFVTHIGEDPQSGHYIAYVKLGDDWYQANDAVISQVNIEQYDHNGENELDRAKKNAYLLHFTLDTLIF